MEPIDTDCVFVFRLESIKLLEEVEFCKKSDAGVPKRIVLYRVVSNNQPIQRRRLGDSTISTVRKPEFSLGAEFLQFLP